MTRGKAHFVFLTAAFVIAGCIESKTVVTVQKDGSGTVEQSVYYTEMDAGAFGFAFGDEDEESGGFDFGEAVKKPTEEEKLAVTRAQAEKMATKMGDGVSLQAVEPLPPRNGRNGVRIVYTFKDINQLRLDPLPEFTMSLGGGFQLGGPDAAMEDLATDGQFGNDSAAAEAEDGSKIRFEFASAPTATLTIYTPEMTPPSGTEAVEDSNPQAKEMARMMMQQMLDGMLLEFRIHVKGRLTDTNATYASRKANAVGLYQLDFGNLVKNQAALDKLISMDPTADSETVKKQLQDPLLARHLKLETKDRVVVSFE